MNLKFLHAIAIVLIGCMLAGCHSDLDLTKIDTSAEVEMGLVLPIGTIHATIGDFWGGQVNNFYIDSVDNKGVITWKDTYPISRDYHQIDLAQYISNASLSLNVTQKLPGVEFPDGSKEVQGMGIPMTLDFPLVVKLNGINNPDSLQKERLDSALIEIASFASTIQTTNGLPLEWDWIDRVTMELGDRIHRPAGNVAVVYDKTDPAFSQYTEYGQRVETNVDNFSIVLMKNLHPSTLIEYLNNVVDSVQFVIHFTFTIPNGTTVTVPKNAGFDYNLDVQFLTYKAIWGMFEPSKDMHDESIIDLAESWGDLEFMTRASLPFAQPKVFVDIVTQVAGALRIRDAYVFSVDQRGERHYAAFGANESRTKTIDFQDDQWLPLTSAIGDSTTNMNFEFNNSSDGGRIDRLFKNIPQELGYRFNVEFNQQTTPQIRITPNTSIKVYATATMPMIFNEGVHIDQMDTIRDINLSKYSIDSLLSNVEFIDTMKASDVTLFLTARNTIPLDIKASMRCLDEHDNILMDPDDPTKPLLLFPQDTILLKAPTYEYSLGTWHMVSEGQTVITAKMSKKKLDVLPQVKSIIYSGLIDDESLDYAYQKGIFNVKLTDDAGLAIKIALTAHADAIFSFDKKDNQQ